MCWKCAGPSPAEFRELLRDIVDQYFFAIQVVQRSKKSPLVAYTIGFTERGKPELVVTGMPEYKAGNLSRDVAFHLLHADERLRPGERIPLIDGPLVEIVPIQVPDAHLDSAVLLYGPNIEAVQLVHAERRGRRPWRPAGPRRSRSAQRRVRTRPR